MCRHAAAAALRARRNGITRRSYIVAACAVALFTVTSAAAGSASQQTRAKEIYAAFTLVAMKKPVMQRCGAFTVTRATYSGRSTSPDARLAGTVKYDGRIVTTDDGTGFAGGRLTIRDRKGAVRLTANVEAVVWRRLNINGIMSGKLRRPSARLLANISMFFEPNFTFAGVRIGLESARSSAVAYSGAGNCA